MNKAERKRLAGERRPEHSSPPKPAAAPIGVEVNDAEQRVHFETPPEFRVPKRFQK